MALTAQQQAWADQALGTGALPGGGTWQEMSPNTVQRLMDTGTNSTFQSLAPQLYAKYGAPTGALWDESRWGGRTPDPLTWMNGSGGGGGGTGGTTVSGGGMPAGATQNTYVKPGTFMPVDAQTGALDYDTWLSSYRVGDYPGPGGGTGSGGGGGGSPGGVAGVGHRSNSNTNPHAAFNRAVAPGKGNHYGWQGRGAGVAGPGTAPTTTADTGKSANPYASFNRPAGPQEGYDNYDDWYQKWLASQSQGKGLAGLTGYGNG
jgi:hypothetical protein